jgi:hypothetical protein
MPLDLSAPWERQGWLRSTSAWIEEQLGDLGYLPTAPIQVVKSWGISCILRVPTDSGDLYLKESLRTLTCCDESTVVPGLGALYPEHIPRVVATDGGRILLRDFGQPIGTALSDVWKDVFTTFGRIQVDATRHIDELLTIGCRDSDASQLADRIVAMAPDTEDGQSLSRLARTLEEMSSELFGHRVPRSLVHGDLHLANVAQCGDDYVFFDWTDCSVSHPFLDVAYIFAENARNEKECRDVYLALWTDYEPWDRLMRMWSLAEPLSALHQAFTYQETASYLAEPARREFLVGVTYFVRQLLKSAVLQ